MTRREPHPLTGAVYEDLGDGSVKVWDERLGKEGRFACDGTWLDGELTQADPHFLLHVGGPSLPPGRDIYWGMTPPVYDPNETPELPDFSSRFRTNENRAAPLKVVGKFVGDPGRSTKHGPRSQAHMDLAFFLENDRHPDRVPDIYWLESPMLGGPKMVSAARYFDKRFHELEVERLWKRTWQMACHVDDIPEIGDYLVYDIATLSFIIIRTGPNTFAAHYNSCPHRGRRLKEAPGRGATELRCPFHGWNWHPDGELKGLPCEWDLPGVREAQGVARLTGAKTETWGGFVFINPDEDAEPLTAFLGPVMIAHYAKFKFERRYKQAHVRKVIRANWKVAQEAFMEAYHITSTHPQLLLGGGDSVDLRYDVFGNWGRAQHVSPSVSSPHRGMVKTPEELLERWRTAADINAQYLRTLIGDEVDAYSDAELNDAGFNDLFPNMHPWGGWARLVFRFRPLHDDPDSSLMDVIFLAPWAKDREKPPAAAVRELSADQSWCEAPELGSLARILSQDIRNLANIQLGLRSRHPPHVWFSAYQEGKIRNFHENYERKLDLAPGE